MPFKFAVLARARLPRSLLAVVLCVAIGLGVAAALHRRGDAGQRPGSGQPASVSRLDLEAGAAPGAASRASTSPAADAPPAGTPAAASSARAAVRAFLAARTRGDHRAAFGQLDRASRARYGSVARWAQAQADTSPVRGFRLTAQRAAGAAAADVTAEVTHPPAIDPFDGLTPGRTLEVWRARLERGRWRVDAEPRSVRPLLPGDGAAPAAVDAWLRALVACDRPAAVRLQVEPDLYGQPDLGTIPCQRRGRWTAGAARAFDDAVDSQPYVAAFGPDVTTWARLVPVQGPRTRFFAVVGPLGDAWRVIGAIQPQGAG